MVSKSSVILAYPPTNILIVTDVYSNIKRLLKILKKIDVTGIGQTISVIPVDFSDATKLVSLLNTVFKPTAKRRKLCAARRNRRVQEGRSFLRWVRLEKRTAAFFCLFVENQPSFHIQRVTQTKKAGTINQKSQPSAKNIRRLLWGRIRRTGWK